MKIKNNISRYKLNVFDIFIILVLFSLLPSFYYGYKLYEIRLQSQIIEEQKQIIDNLKNEISKLSDSKGNKNILIKDLQHKMRNLNH